MKFARLAMIASLMILVMLSQLSAQSTLSAEAQLRAAMNRETVERDLPGAIEQYKQIARTFASNHFVASKALLQLGGIYERLGKPESRAAYQRIVSEYGDAGSAVAEAKARLRALQESAAGPFRVRSLGSQLGKVNVIGVSPDGKLIAYTRQKATGSGADDPIEALCIADIESGRERIRLDPKAGERGLGFNQLNWSPDSKFATYAVGVSDRIEYRLLNVATRDVRSIGAGLPVPGTFMWSPDSKQVAYAVRPTKDTGELRVTSVGAASSESNLLDAFEAKSPGFGGVTLSWSPDSRRLAYGITATGPTDTIKIVTVLTKEVATIAAPKETPTTRLTVWGWTQSNQIRFSQTTTVGNNFYLVDPSTSAAPRMICEGRGPSGGDGCGSLSPDGALQVVRKNASGGGRIVLRRISDRSETPLTPEAVLETDLGFSPDGRLLVFRSNRDGAYGVYVVPISAIPVARPTKIATLESAKTNVSVFWTPGGLILRVTDNQLNQYRIDLDPKTRRPLGAPVRLTEDAPTNKSPVVSPDGRRIAYIAEGPANGFATMDANGAHERVFKEVPVDRLDRMALIGWLSDAELLITDPGLGTGAVRSAPKVPQSLNIMTGELHSIGPAIEGHGIHLLTGGRVTYINNKDELRIRGIDGGPERVVEMKDWWDFAVSEDGHWTAISTADDSGGPNKPMPGDIRLHSVDSGADRILVKFADTKQATHMPISLSSDGKWLLYQDPNAISRVMNTETADSWPLLTNPSVDIDFDWAVPRWAPDGSFVVIDGSTSKTNWRGFEGVTVDAVNRLVGLKR